MSRRTLLLLVLAACPGDDESNPSTLWLAPNMSETQVKLVDSEPRPF